MSIQADVGKVLSTASTAASVAKGFSIAKEKEAQYQEAEMKKEQEAAARKAKEADKEAERKQAESLKAQKRAEAEKKAAEREEAAKAKEKKIQERQDLLFLEQSQNKIESQRRAIAGIDKKLPELDANIEKYRKASRNRRSGRQAMAEAKAKLDDYLDQKETFIADRTTRHTLLKEREQMMANVRKEFNYGEE